MTDQEAAYLAGVIATDGSVERRGPKFMRIRLGMGPKGWSMMEQLAAITGRNLSKIRTTPKGFQYRTLDWRDLPAEWKTEVPELAYAQKRSYLRGLYDGDGCLTRSGKQPMITFSHAHGSEVHANFIEDYLLQEEMSYTDSQTGHVRQLMVCNWLHAGELASYLYHPGDLAIEHKLSRARVMADELEDGLLSGRRSWYT